MLITMLAIKASEHPLMKWFYRPGDEKRSLVILRPEEYDDWLGARSIDEARSFLNLFPAEEMYAEAVPRPLNNPAPKPDDDA